MSIVDSRGGVIAAAAVFAMISCSLGCTATHSNLMTPARLDNGYTLVLPGVLGHNFWDDNVVEGLTDAKLPAAIELYDWTQGPIMVGMNVFNESRRQQEIAKLTQKIVKYQNQHPGRPVYLIGHSGGASIAVEVLEKLPEQRRVTGAVLLAATMPRDYDLRKAQSRTQHGLHSFYAPNDVLIGQGFGALFALKNQSSVVSAAIVGFQPPAGLSAEDAARYESLLVQHKYTRDQRDEGNTGGHFGCTNREFVRDAIAPILAEMATAEAPTAAERLASTSETDAVTPIYR